MGFIEHKAIAEAVATKDFDDDAALMTSHFELLGICDQILHYVSNIDERIVIKEFLWKGIL